MKNIAPGLSLKKYKGNKHEQGGIMVNALGNKTKDINKAVAEVEGGEYSYRSNPNNPKGPYILSAELGTAKIAEQADRFRDNDRISYNTRTNLLNKSVKLNEILKAQQEQSQMQMQQAAFGGMLKRYDPGGLLPTSNRAVSTPENELTNVPMQPIAPLLSGSQKFNLPTKIQSVNPQVNADTKTLDVSKEMQQAQVAGDNPVKQKKNNFKGALSAVAGAVSALGPIGQGVGAAMQLAPYAIDLGKAMFDKTSVQDLQTQGSAMRLPNTTYAKHGGKLNVTPLPKFKNGGDTLTVKDINPFEMIRSTKVTGVIPNGKVNSFDDQFDKRNAARTTGNIPLSRIIDMNSAFDARSPITTTGLINSKETNLQELITTPFNRRGTGDPYNLNPTSRKIEFKPNSDINRRKSFYETPSYIGNNNYEYPFNPIKKDTLVTTTDNKSNAGKNKGNNKGNTGGSKSTPSDKKSTTTDNTPISTNMLPSRGLMLPGASSIAQSAKDRFDKDNLEREKEYETLVGKALNKFDVKGTTPTKTTTSETPESESSRLFKAGQSKQKLSEALMYGMAALPSEKIKTITPDYGRGDDAMSRMGLSTEPIRQEMMQGANKALELSRSQVGTAGQLQSRGQSIMGNLSSQLSQSQIQQQQYLNQLRGALAQREDTKSNVLAQSELTAREAKSAERAAKLDQLNNAISQTSAIGAGTMEQASKMSTIENENERFARSQEQLTELANRGVNFKVVVEDGKPVLKYDTGSGNSTITAPSLAKQQPTTTGTGTPPVAPASNAVIPAATTGTTYTIKKGDTLYAIAKANNTTVSNLVKANGFANDNALLLPGKTIKLK